MPYVGQQSPSGNQVWNGSRWVTGPGVDMGAGVGVDVASNDLAGREQVAASYDPAQYASSTPPRTANGPTAVGQPVLQRPLSLSTWISNNGKTVTYDPATGRLTVDGVEQPAGTQVGGYTAGHAGGPWLAPTAGNAITDQPGRSVGGQLAEAIATQEAAGNPITNDFALALWKRAGLTDQQAALVHDYVRNWQIQTGKRAGGPDLDDVLGQVKAGQAPDASRWRSQVGGGGSAGARSGGHFRGADSDAHLNDLIKNNKGDMAVLAERLLGNQEKAQGGRFAAPIRNTFGTKAQALEGLLGLEAAGDPSKANAGGMVADVFDQNLGAGSKYDTPGQGVGKGLLNAAITGATPTGQAYLKGDSAAQLKALKAALGIDNSPLLQNQIEQDADELYKQWLGQHATDPNAVTAFGSFLEHAKKNNRF